MEAGLDTGPILLEARTPIGSKAAGGLTEELAGLGAELIVQVLADIARFPERPQPAEGVTYARKIDKAEARLDFSAGAAAVIRQVQAFAPTPGAFFELDGERYKVFVAERSARDGSIPQVWDFPTAPGKVLDDHLVIGCGNGAIRPGGIQRAGKPAMNVDDLLRGRPIPPGTRLA